MDTAELARFHAKVVRGPGPGDCWIWTGAIGDDGYGRFWTPTGDGGQRMIRAHRYALATVHGGLDALDELHACHTCDNPICVRAEDAPTSHLYAGTASENMADRSRRGHHNKQRCDPRRAPGTPGGHRPHHPEDRGEARHDGGRPELAHPPARAGDHRALALTPGRDGRGRYRPRLRGIPVGAGFHRRGTIKARVRLPHPESRGGGRPRAPWPKDSPRKKRSATRPCPPPGTPWQSRSWAH